MRNCTSTDSDGSLLAARPGMHDFNSLHRVSALGTVSPWLENRSSSYPGLTSTELLNFNSPLPNHGFHIPGTFSEPASVTGAAYEPPPPVPHLLPAISMQFPSVPKPVTGNLDPPAPENENDRTQAQFEAQQEELRDARDDLVGSRFSLHTKRRELRKLQEEADLQASIAFDLVRRYVHTQGLTLPAEIEVALTKAAASRERQVERGVDLEEAEEKYNLEEWRYTEKETSFIEDLPANLSVSRVHQLPVPLLETRNVDPESVTTFSVGPSDFRDAPNALREPQGHLLSSPIGNSFFESEHSFHDFNSYPEPNVGERPSEFHYRPLTPLFTYNAISAQHFGPIQPPLRPHSDTDLSRLQVDWTATRKRIDTWLFDVLSVSRLQQGLLKDLTPRDELSDEAWWRLIEQHWSSNSPGPIDFHTGDSTISGSARSQPISNMSMTRLFESLEPVNPEANASFATPLISEDRVIDDIQPVDFPPAFIAPRDLDDSSGKHVTFQTQSSANSITASLTNSTPSISTSPTEMTRSWPRVDDSTMLKTCSFTAQYEEGGMAQNVDVAEENNPTAESRYHNTHVDALPRDFEASSQNESSASTPKHRSSFVSDAEEHQKRFLEEQISLPSFTYTRSYFPESEHNHITMESNEHLQFHQSTSDESHMRPPTPPQTRSCSPNEPGHSPDASGPRSGTDSAT